MNKTGPCSSTTEGEGGEKGRRETLALTKGGWQGGCVVGRGETWTLVDYGSGHCPVKQKERKEVQCAF